MNVLPHPVLVEIPSSDFLDPHLLYLRRFLDGEVDLSDEENYLVPGREEDTFWEVIGFRLRGHRSVLLGAIEFRRQVPNAPLYSRRSLAHYLTAPPRTVSVDQPAYPANMIEVRVPHVSGSIEDFLTGLRTGATGFKTLLDRDLIELAFDLRPDNPSVERSRLQSDAANLPLTLRTTGGQILTGCCQGMTQKLHRDQTFLGITHALQHTRNETFHLPNLIVNRHFLAALAPAEVHPKHGAVPPNVAPFQVDAASQIHLLDPRL